MYLDCENQYDLKIGMILLDIEHNKEYVIINYNLCEDTYYTTMTCISIEEYMYLLNNKYTNIDIYTFKTLITIDINNICDFDIVKDKSVKVNSKIVYNFI